MTTLLTPSYLHGEMSPQAAEALREIGEVLEEKAGSTSARPICTPCEYAELHARSLAGEHLVDRVNEVLGLKPTQPERADGGKHAPF